MEKAIHRQTLTLAARRMVGTSDGQGLRATVIGYENVTVEVVVDLAQLARELGPKAARNNSGKARSGYGAVIVHVVGRAKVVAGLVEEKGAQQ